MINAIFGSLWLYIINFFFILCVGYALIQKEIFTTWFRVVYLYLFILCLFVCTTYNFIWYLTHDISIMTDDIWFMTHWWWWTLFQNVRFLVFRVRKWRWLEDSEEKDDLFANLTDPATPGLLKLDGFRPHW